MLDLYTNIRKKREELGISQEELAKKTGYTSRSSIAKIEKGLVDLPQTKIEIFAKALNTTPSCLMGWDKAQEIITPTQEELQKIQENSYENLVIKEMGKLNQKGKVRLLDTAREMTCNPLYNKNYQLELNAAHARTDIKVTKEMRQHDDDLMKDDSEWT